MVPFDNVGQSISGTPGTGTVTLGSAMDNSFFTFAEAGVADASVVTYRIEFGLDVEIGRGTYTSSGTTLSRDTVLASKIGGTAGTSKIDINAAGATVRIVMAAADFATFRTTTVELGHNTDTTLGRGSAGVLQVEGVTVLTTATGQPLDELLTEIAALSTDPNADSGLFFDDSAGAMAFWTPSSPLAFSGTSLTVTAGSTTAQGVLEIATASEWRTGTDTARALGVAETWNAGAEVTLTDAATIAIDFATGINFVVTLGGNRTLGNPTNEKVGQMGFIRVVQDGTGGRTLSTNTDWEWAGGAMPSISTTAADQSVIFYYILASNRVLGTILSDIS